MPLSVFIVSHGDRVDPVLEPGPLGVLCTSQMSAKNGGRTIGDVRAGQREPRVGRKLSVFLRPL